MKKNIFYYAISFVAAVFMTACNDDDVTINQEPIIKAIETGNVDVTATTATVYGHVSDLSSQHSDRYSVGAVFSVSEDPTVSGTRQPGSVDGNGDIVVELAGLQDGVTYYYATYVTLQDKLTYYGDVKSFVTTDAMIATAEAASVNQVSAKLGGTLNGVNDMLEAESSALVYGVMLSTDQNESSIKKGLKILGSGTTNSYSIDVENLLPSTDYYFVSFMELDGNTFYGDIKHFTTETQEIEYIDMGLSVLWANCNLGSMYPEEMGGLYGYGDTSGLNRSVNLSDYPAVENIAASDFDICMNSIDGRIPTEAEFNELIINCNPVPAEQNGVKGYKFTARNGNTLFLPLAGLREGDEITQEGNIGAYWTGSIYSHNDYAYALSLSEKAELKQALRYQGLSIRPVKAVETEGLKFDNYKLVYGDLENNGNFRIEMYNAYGDTGKDPGLDISELNFSQCVTVTFTISGVSSSDSHEAYIGFASSDWSFSNWGYKEGEGCIVKGDGSYTVKLNGKANGANVFVVDIKGLSTACGGADGITATINKIVLDDWGTRIPFDNYKLVAGDLENNGKYRIELFNAYGDTGKDPGLDINLLNFTKRVGITFTIKGIKATGDFKANIGFASSDWSFSNWGYTEGEGCIVNGDGTYTVTLNGAATGANVFVVDIDGLSAANGGTDGIVSTIDAVRVE